MTTRWKKLGIRTMAGLAVATGPTIAACSSGPSYEDWAATDGAAGRINLDDVQVAFKGAKGTSDFERRVNQIFEGDGIVLIRAEQTGDALVLEGWEDLNGNNAIDDTQDDKLFSITKGEDNSHEMRGYNTNSYYRSGFGGGDFLFTYMLLSAVSGPRYFYATSPVQARSAIAQRSSYRSSGSYNSQVRTNSNYFSKQKGFAGSQYDSASRNVSTARQSYQSTAKTSGSFKSSSTGVRSSWGTVGRSSGFSSGGRGGGFRGGGGGQTIIGSIREMS